jgi:hypothetical protein
MIQRLFSKKNLKTSITDEDDDEENKSKQHIIQLKLKYDALITELIDLEFKIFAEELLFLQKRINKK